MFPDQTCELLLDPYNGKVHQTGRYFGDRAIYTCNMGYQIIGPEERVCQATGMWSNQEPYCKKRGRNIADTASSNLYTVRVKCATGYLEIQLGGHIADTASNN